MDNYEEISFDPSFMEVGDKKPKEVENVDFFNEDNFGLNPKKEVEEPKSEDDLEDKIDDTDTDEDASSPKEINEESLFSVVLGQDLVERGVLSSFDEAEVRRIATEQDEAAALSYMIEKQTESIQETIKSSYSKEYQDYLTMIQGGVPKEEAAGIQRIEQFSNSLKDIDLKSEDEGAVSARKDLLTLHYRLSTKFSDEKISKLIDKMYDEGSDLDEVDEALANVNTYIEEEKTGSIERAKQQEEQVKQSQEKWLNDLSTYVNKTEEYIKGDKVTKQVKDKMIKSLTTPVKLSNGQVVSQVFAIREKDPIAFDSRLAYLEAIGYFEGKPLDKFIKNATTKTTTQLNEWLNDNKGNGRGYSGQMNNNKSDKKTSAIDRALFGEA